MNAQPTTPIAGLVVSGASTDTAAPTSTITAPANGSSVPNGTPVTVVGTATDTGGQVGGIEVSLDGGTTWHPAQGGANWTYTFTPGSPGSTLNIKTRAADDSGNIEIPGAGITINVTQRSCGNQPCSIWDQSVTPKLQSNTDTTSIELGVKFTSGQDGYIKGVRFYKGANNSGTHTAALWSSSGTQLATAQFINETATGWQQANFPTPVAITNGLTYVASYHAPNGGYASDVGFFATTGVDNSPLHALQNGVSGPNGVFVASPVTAFPTNTFNSTNYWVDVVYSTSAIDNVPPAVQSSSPSPNSTNAPTDAVVTATFSKPVVANSINFVLREAASGAVVSTTFNYDPNT